MPKGRKKIFAFGEIMLRVSPALSGERIGQASTFIIEPGGSEANVAIALSLLGNRCGFITRLPGGVLSDKVISYLRSYSVEDNSSVVFGGERLGLYWTEIGSGLRPSRVIYDRENSSFSKVNYAHFDWDMIFRDAKWFHVSGISPAVSKNAYRTVKEALDIVPAFVKISIDLNYRSKLWKWVKKKPSSVHKIMGDICSKAYLITGNETDFFNCLGIDNGQEKRDDDYKRIAVECFRRFKKLGYVAVSIRKQVSASENGWSGLLFTNQKGKITVHKGPELQITDIADRVGTGDTFTAGIIHGLVNNDAKLQHLVDFAVGLSALNHSVRGDASQFRIEDVEHLLNNPGGRIVR